MTSDEFKASFPQFKDVVGSVVDQKIADFSPLFNASDWGDFYALGFGNLIAHELEFDKLVALKAGDPIGAGDAITKTVARGSIARAAENVMAQMKNPYYRTLYGQKFLYYLDCAFSGGVVY